MASSVERGVSTAMSNSRKSRISGEFQSGLSSTHRMRPLANALTACSSRDTAARRSAADGGDPWSVLAAASSSSFSAKLASNTGVLTLLIRPIWGNNARRKARNTSVANATHNTAGIALIASSATVSDKPGAVAPHPPDSTAGSASSCVKIKGLQVGQDAAAGRVRRGPGLREGVEHGAFDQCVQAGAVDREQIGTEDRRTAE